MPAGAEALWLPHPCDRPVNASASSAPASYYKRASASPPSSTLQGAGRPCVRADLVLRRSAPCAMIEQRPPTGADVPLCLPDARTLTWAIVSSHLTPAGWAEPWHSMPSQRVSRPQAMSERDYADFLAVPQSQLPPQSILMSAMGESSGRLLTKPPRSNPKPSTYGQLASACYGFDPRYFATYYAIDAINFTPGRSARRSTVLAAPYLPLIVQEGPPECARFPHSPQKADPRALCRPASTAATDGCPENGRRFTCLNQAVSSRALTSPPPGRGPLAARRPHSRGRLLAT